ncbi:site-specific integrase [Natronolimnobius sp. AArcel1]|nr:site-specific integrase [Natronolimnobius sp. AArcel1]
MTPQKAKDKYLKDREDDARYDTIDTIQRGLDHFITWCEYEGIENLNTIGGRELLSYKNWCKENTENNTVSLNGLLSILRRFLVFCVKIEAVKSKVPDKVPIPKIPDDEDVCYEKPTDEEVEQAVAYLETYEPASRRHVEYAIIKENGNRVGALRAIDEEDVDLKEQVIEFQDRQENDYTDEKGTPLKNGTDGEREINISKELAELIRRYLNNPDRHDVTDMFGREPLLTTRYGRPSVETIRRDLYKLTRPCTYADSCPHDRDIDSCEATKSYNASKCPSSHSPHPLRRWSIEHQIDRGVPKDQLSDRVDVSVPVLNKHYDLRKEERKRKQRLKTFEKLFDGYGDPDATLSETELAALMNDDGMIDPVALNELIAKSEKEQTPSHDRSSNDSDTEGERDEGQLGITDFSEGPNAVWQPAVIPVLAGVAVGKWIPGRLTHELEALAPPSEDSPWPNQSRAAKGMAAYALYVCLVSVNFALLGLLPA